MNIKVKKIDSGEKIQREILRKFSGEKRVYLGAELYEMVSQLIKDGLRSRHSGEEKEIESKTKEILAPWSKKTH
ncbi:MAG: hypothetical protein FJZ13_03630 [Candidatus Omnitrophica bacterium]|nr:hypothetical protein [Candidatus Omnitrophota bacterium]